MSLSDRRITMLRNILVWLFGPSVRSLGKFEVLEYAEYEEQGWAGNVQFKQYRDGIERTFAEEGL